MPRPSWKILLIILAVAVVPLCNAQDADRDGISDSRERTLLSVYRPYYRFSRDHGSGETFRPADVRAYLAASEIDGTGSEGANVLLPNPALQLDNIAILGLRAGDRGSSDLVNHPQRADYYVNPVNDARRGVEWAQVLARRNVGLYGHVVPVRLSSAEAYDLRHVPSSADASKELFYKIEYWQFFGYNSNDQPNDAFDHEGDWTTVQVIISPGNTAAGIPPRLRSVLYYAHGKEMRFDLSSKTGQFLAEGNTVMRYVGPNVNVNVPDLDDECSATARQNHQCPENKASNNQVSFYREPGGGFTHPVVYIERGSHEFWPVPIWSYRGAQKHGGDDLDHQYLTSTPPNLGEVEHPLSEDPAAMAILQFNGRWGTYSRGLGPAFPAPSPPPGPPLHYEWTWPADSSIRWQLKGIEY